MAHSPNGGHHEGLKVASIVVVKLLSALLGLTCLIAIIQVATA